MADTMSISNDAPKDAPIKATKRFALKKYEEVFIGPRYQVIFKLGTDAIFFKDGLWILGAEKEGNRISEYLTVASNKWL